MMHRSAETSPRVAIALGCFLLVACASGAGANFEAAAASATACASPLRSGPTPDAADWDDVRLLKADKSLNPAIEFVQTLGDTGAGDLNLDYYAITVDRTGSAKGMFAEFRKQMGELLFRNKTATREGFYSLRGYDSANEAKWASSTPVGALMTFVLFQRAGMEFERGSVVVACSDDTSFVLSTVNTPADGDHPVSGNRAFGIVDNNDGSVTFFTKAADRVKGSSYFDLLGKAQRAATFRAGSTIWERLLDNISRAFSGKNPRNEIKHRRAVPYLQNPDTVPHPTSPAGRPLIVNDTSAFRNGVREYADARALYDGKLTVGTTADMARSALVSETGSAESNSASAYAFGLVYGAAYTENVTTLLMQRSAELGRPATANLAIPTNALVGEPALEAAATLLSVVSELPLIPGLRIDDPAVAFRRALAGLPAHSRNTKEFADGLESAVKGAAYSVVRNQIAETRKNLEQAASAAALALVGNNMDLEKSDVDLLLAMRQYSSHKLSIRLLELENLGQASVVAFKLLASIPGQCPCFSSCTPAQVLCTLWDAERKLATWQTGVNMRQLAKWGASIGLEQYAPTYGAYLGNMASYADKIRSAGEIYAKFYSARRILEAATAVEAAANDLTKLDLLAATKDAVAGQLAGLRAGLRDGHGMLCGVPSYGEAEPASCRLLTQGRLIEHASQRLANSLVIIDKELAHLPELHTTLAPLVAQAQILARIASREVRPRIEALYAAAQTMRRRANLPQLDSAALTISILDPAGLTPAVRSERAAVLATVQEEARRLAEVVLMRALEFAAAPPLATPVPQPAPIDSGSTPPASVTLTSLTVELASLYASTGQTPEIIQERFKETRTPFLFFRQFPPYFYARALVRLAAEPKLISIRRVISDYRGWVVGDPHLQNFGTFIPFNVNTVRQLDTKKAPKLTVKPADDCESKRIGDTARLVMNDMDDGGEGSPALDLVRYLVGLELYSPGTARKHIEPLLQAYLKAVEGRWKAADHLSGVSRELLKDANPQVKRVGGAAGLCTLVWGMTPSRKYVDSDLTRFTKMRDDARSAEPLSPVELKQAENVARAIIGADASILDSYKYGRFRGGSGGNWRWELLIRPGPPISRGNAPDVPLMSYWLELKGLALIPGSYPASAVDYASVMGDAAATAAKNRYRALIALTQGGDDAFGAYRLVDTVDGPALARFRFSGQAMFDIEGLSEAKLLELAKDQLSILGKIHSESLSTSTEPKTPSSYAVTLGKSTLELTTLVGELADDLNAGYAALGT